MRYPAINSYQYSSFRNALRLLQLFSVEKPEIQLEDIAGKLEIGPSTAFRLVHTLMVEGFIVRDSASKSYRLAASVLAFGHTLLKKENLYHLSIEIIEKLAERTGETAHIAICKDEQVLYLLKIESTHPVHLLSHAGRKNPLHCTSTGQVLLAFQKDSLIERVIDRGLSSYTLKTITDSSKLKDLLHTIKMKGFAVSKEELHEGVVSIAAPVLNRKSHIMAAVSIAGPASRINDRTIPKLTKQVQQAADEVTKKMKSLF
ncbi:IclR family transcriptional regulator [Neobacillus cucumis]|uniref:IclR family transcriptional regulator n=1 Tax=Neobacillus cucumis TaxID=1740721 RepID=A0A2N5H8H1_9BACI|nr:IclR family transcriptional regulator [Neobacillus cucumis]PLS01813.1 IclR family transcriptional regulator [Neobacillus cucumis]